jgi:hypothetical protein
VTLTLGKFDGGGTALGGNYFFVAESTGCLIGPSARLRDLGLNSEAKLTLIAFSVATARFDSESSGKVKEPSSEFSIPSGMRYSSCVG